MMVTMIYSEDGTGEITQWLSERDTRPVEGRPFPVLCGWADLIRSWECGDTDERPSPFDAWRYFSTDPIVDDELMELSNSHPGVASQISEMVTFCEQHFGRLVRYPKASIRGEESDSASARQKRLTNVASSNLAFGITRLRARINQAIEITERGDDEAATADGRTVNDRVREYVAKREAEGFEILDFTRDGIATAIGFSGGAVSRSPTWKQIARLKRQSKLPSTTKDQFDAAMNRGDWKEVARLQHEGHRPD